MMLCFTEVVEEICIFWWWWLSSWKTYRLHNQYRIDTRVK